MGKTRRRGGAWSDYINPLNWGKSQADIAAAKAEKCKKKQAEVDKECSPAESVAPETPEVATASAEMSGAPAAPAVGARRRRRYRTRRTYKGGKHRRSH